MGQPYTILLPRSEQDFNTIASKIREDLKQRGTTDSEMDRGTSRRVWFPRGAPSLQVSRPNGQVDTRESFQEAFRRLEEISLGRPNFSGELCKPGNQSSFFCFFKESASFLPPWLMDDGREDTAADGLVRGKISGIVKKTGEGSPTRRIIAQRLLTSLTTPHDQGGLGMEYDGGKIPKKDGVEASVHKTGDCNAFSYLFYVMAWRAGLNPEFIRVAGKKSYSSGVVEEMFHIAVAVRLDPDHPDQLTPLDPSQGVFLDQSYQWYPVSLLEMQAYHLRNVALENVPKDLSEGLKTRWQESLLKKAEALAPEDFEIQYDLAKFYLETKHDREKARFHLGKARQINPSLKTIWNDVP